MSTPPLQIGDLVTPAHTIEALRIDEKTGHTFGGYTEVANGMQYEVTALSGPFADLTPTSPGFRSIRCETADLERW